MTENNLRFSITWNILHLLGEQLYSNHYSALSELIANGLDAKATEIKVIIDQKDGEEKSLIEVLDNGHGMNFTDLEYYTRLGVDRRVEHKAHSSESNENLIMGRKGVGKLAGFYRSKGYRLGTKAKDSDVYFYEIMEPTTPEDQKKPIAFTKVDESHFQSSKGIELFAKQPTGTLIQMWEVDLRKHGRQKSENYKRIEVLVEKLSQQFAATFNNQPRLVLLHRAPDSSEFIDIELQRKYEPQKNLLYILASSEDPSDYSFENPKGIKVRVRNVDDPVQQEYISFNDSPEYAESDDQVPTTFDVKGWIGLNATIDKKLAGENNKSVKDLGFFPDCELRLYVRKKLAIRNLMPFLKLTATYANYIEGEIECDFLDDDALDDIATLSRQSIEENDPRFIAFTSFVREKARHLINKRNELNEVTNKKHVDATAAASQQYLDAALKLLGDNDQLRNKFKNLHNSHVNSIAHTYKDKRLVFISHVTKEKAVADIIYKTLIARGADESEIFYTASPYFSTYHNHRGYTLDEQLRSALMGAETAVLYVCTKGFRNSDYCMFEAGAGWLLHSSDQTHFVVEDFKYVPQPISKNAEQANNIYVPPPDGLKAAPSPEFLASYNSVCAQINRVIGFLNEGRQKFKTRTETIKAIELGSGIPLDKEIIKLWEESYKYLEERKKEEEKTEQESFVKGLFERINGNPQIEER